jgi:hypothetical protein
MALILPLDNPKPEHTKPYKDWLRTCGINGVVDEDYTMRIWERWMLKARRHGRKTQDSVLHKEFPQQHYLKQLDIQIDEARSSDINLQLMGYTNRLIYKNVAPVTVSEHSVRRWWEHTNAKPDIMSWIDHALRATLTATTTELHHPDALMLGTVFRSDNVQLLYSIDHKQFIRVPGIGFRIKTVIPAHMLNEGQRYRWYCLQEALQ